MVPVWLYAPDGRALYCVYVQTPMPSAVEYPAGSGRRYVWEGGRYVYVAAPDPCPAYTPKEELPFTYKPTDAIKSFGASGEDTSWAWEVRGCETQGGPNGVLILIPEGNDPEGSKAAALQFSQDVLAGGGSVLSVKRVPYR